MHLKSILTIFVAVVPLITATGGQYGKYSNCRNNEFWWNAKKSCLINGGPPSAPSPPKDTKCPPSTHYWHSGQGCCAPRNPPKENNPPPQCPKNWEWKPALHKCSPCTTPPSPPPHQPSPKPYNKDKDRKWYRSELRKRANVAQCPSEMEACPVKGLTDNLSDDYVCIDTSTELESCGGCTTLGKGQDCTKIEGAWNVGCEQGICRVYSCDGGYQLAEDGKTCTAL